MLATSIKPPLLRCGALLILGLMAIFATSVVASANDVLTVISFNVESGDDTDPAKVAEDMSTIAEGVDLWALTEVGNRAAANAFRKGAAVGNKVRYILGDSGHGDHLAILYNLNTLKLKSTEELDDLPGSRKPLVAHLQHKESRVEFLFVVSHFNRRDAPRRQNQSERLRKWARGRRLPVILAGDFNFDFDPRTGRGNRAFDIFTQGSDVKWVAPRCVATGNCPRTGTQCDPDYNSILDFVFLAGPAKAWDGESQILFRERDYCRRDRRGYADHRPVIAMLRLQKGT